jgi:protein-arginine kinase
MAIHNILNTSGEWLRGEGPHHQIVVSSRVRLARNLKGFAFPGWAKKQERLQILEAIKPQVEALPEMRTRFPFIRRISPRSKSRCSSSGISSAASTRPRVWAARGHESAADAFAS